MTCASRRLTQPRGCQLGVRFKYLAPDTKAPGDHKHRAHEDEGAVHVVAIADNADNAGDMTSRKRV